MKYELQRISVWSAVKIAFVLNLLFGFLIGILYAFFLMVMAALPAAVMGEEAEKIFPAFAGVAALFLPFFFAFLYGIIGAIAAAIGTFIYNVLVKMTGGLEFELKEIPAVIPVTAASTIYGATSVSNVPPPPTPPPPPRAEPGNPDYTL